MHHVTLAVQTVVALPGVMLPGSLRRWLDAEFVGNIVRRSAGALPLRALARAVARGARLRFADEKGAAAAWALLPCQTLNRWQRLPLSQPFHEISDQAWTYKKP